MAIGIYIHVPFCISKCSYCDFYSLAYSEKKASEYTKKLLCEIKRWGSELQCPADTLYFGGGTPNLLNHREIIAIIDAAKDWFSLNGAEITVEANPAEDLTDYFKALKKAGVNRISLGMQSANENELEILNRRHNSNDVACAVKAARSAGIDNISLDIMLGIPNQNIKSLKQTLDFAISLNPKHISTYMLSLEKDTLLYKNKEKYNFPSTDETCDMYLYVADYLKKFGFERYAISNFAKKGYESKHNLKYWQGEEYLGLGPAAHSYLRGKRFYYTSNLLEFLENAKIIFDSYGGSAEETVMLNLRLSTGISLKETAQKYNISEEKQKAATIKLGQLEKAGLIYFNEDNISLTDKGALVSNKIILEIIELLF